MKQLTKNQAIAFYQNELWRNLTSKEMARFQLFQNRLCVPFEGFRSGIEELFDRPIFSHEFADVQALRDEYLTKKPKPTLNEIFEKLPRDKLLLVKL